MNQPQFDIFLKKVQPDLVTVKNVINVGFPICVAADILKILHPQISLYGNLHVSITYCCADRNFRPFCCLN